MTEQYLRHCTRCGGTIQLPTHGVGQEILCPHCGETVSLQAESAPSPQLSRGGLFFLSKFRSRTELTELGPSSRWDGILDASLSTVINQFVEMGFLEPAKLSLTELVGRRSSKELQQLCKARGLPVSGTKDKMAKRLAEADPAGTEKLVTHGKFFHCTARGRELAEAFIKAEHDAEHTAIAQALSALRQQNIDDACSTIAAYRKRSSLHAHPALPQIDLRDRRVLHSIFISSLKRHASFDRTQTKNMRVAAAMMQLMGTNNAAPYLEEGLRGSDIEWSLESRMLLFRGLEITRRDEMKSAGIKRVEILGSGGCAVCAADNEKTYTIDHAPLLPHEDCTCQGGCACLLTAKLG